MKLKENQRVTVKIDKHIISGKIHYLDLESELDDYILLELDKPILNGNWNYIGWSGAERQHLHPEANLNPDKYYWWIYYENIIKNTSQLMDTE